MAFHFSYLPMPRLILIAVVFVCGLGFQNLYSQKKKLSILPFPAVYYTPETQWAYGAALTATFRFPKDSANARPSQATVGVVFTQLKQSLYYLPFQIFLKNAQYYFYGELGFYKYNYYYYGIGQSAIPRETYGVDFPRIRINALKKISSHLYAGLRYQYEDYQITQTEPNGDFANGKVTGTPRSITSGVGLGLLYDTRDVIFFPSKGTLFDIAFFHNAPIWGSSVRFERLTADLAAYRKTAGKMILVGNLFGSFTRGHPPFNMLSEVGGGKRMRGYYQGRFRDDNLLLAQTELRFNIFRRWGGAVFASSAVLGNQKDILRLNDPKFTYGTGVRFTANRRDHLNIRLDYALGKDGGNFYFTIGEAF